jgi:sulfite exporter TauE/SafE
MHCKACEALIQSDLEDQSDITSAHASLADGTLEVTGDFGDASVEVIGQQIAQVLAPRGYLVSVHASHHAPVWEEFVYAVPIALGFVMLFIALQKIGIVNLVQTGDVGYGTAFVIGIVASLSTCMAIVGGLLLSLSATFAAGGGTTRSQMLFHVGRLIGFFVLGGVIGVVGSAIQLGPYSTFVIGAVVGLVMLVLGVNLLDITDRSKRWQLALPATLSKQVTRLTQTNHALTPALIGVATFFLPCGFTQAIQVYALSTGSFLRASGTMLVFAIGTFPVLALISFSSFRMQRMKRPGIFLKAAGLIVILFAVFNLVNSLVAVGWIQPFLNVS